MNERDKIRKALKEQYPEIEWPEVRMEVPEGYWQEAKKEAMAKFERANTPRRSRNVWISLVSLAAALLFLLMIWNPFATSSSDPLADVTEGELEQFLVTVSGDLQESDWAYLLASKGPVELNDIEIELSEEDWNTIIEEWPFELNEQTIYELQNQKQ